MKARTRGGARNGGLGVLHSPHGVELVVGKGPHQRFRAVAVQFGVLGCSVFS
jgi:hypothetical protein